MDKWPKQNPYAGWPIKASFELRAPWNSTEYAEPECFSAVLDSDGNVVDPANIQFNAQGAKCK